ncbi:hypothetical protein C8N32_10325 [Rhodovulum imhoffii]|uniref:Uncharacterized protein n=1 Tax=Rhodovulum imhoffii TaxID=365340 RepID=A0A2T5BUH7_9RHOB|nr:hypothetical protein [Rhodovulum imhoffii]PTN03183.1 hypothetical protein C8N32_10325 [Rhodovulum imhoffii]
MARKRYSGKDALKLLREIEMTLSKDRQVLHLPQLRDNPVRLVRLGSHSGSPFS